MSWSDPVISWPRSRRSPASDAIAVPAIAERWIFIESPPSFDRSSLEDLEACLFAVAGQTRLHAQGQGDVRAVDVPARQPQGHRDVQPRQGLPDDVLEGEVRRGRWVASLHVPEHDSPDAVEGTRRA